LIVVGDLKRSIEFYKLLGFDHLETIQRPRDQVAVMRLGSTKVEMMHLPEGEETNRPPRRLSDTGFRHIGIRVDDVQAVYDELKNEIQFDSPPRPIPGRGGRLTVFFKDPDGVELHFVQE
jgi:catechol 2,3-dioxygenase-like lactoylglutathione lyase family enzyme